MQYLPAVKRIDDSTGSPWRRVGLVADVSEGRPHGVTVGEEEVVLIRRGASVSAYEGRCPHEGTLLSEGEIEAGALVCSAHGWRFDCSTGARIGLPRVCLRAYEVKIEQGAVFVATRAPQATTAAMPRGSVSTRRLRDLPGPRGWPLVGNTFQIDVPRLHHILEKWSERFGPLYRASVGGRTAIVVADPLIAESLLRARPHALRRTSLIEPIFAEVGAAGVFSAEGAAWKPQRKLAMEALSNRNSRAFFPTLRVMADRLRRRWAASVGKTLKIQDDLMRFTVDVTTALAFGTDLNTIDGDGHVLQRHLSHIFPAFARRIVAPFPYWRWLKLPADRRLDRALVEVRRIQDRLVAEARTRLAALPEEARQPKNFLEAMLLAKDDEGKLFSDEIIHGNVLTMLLAGEDTTANTIAWIVHRLCERPDVIERARGEIDSVMGEHLVAPDFESAHRFPFLDAIVNETMRLQPVAPLLGLETNEEVTVGDVLVPRGTYVTLLTRQPAKDPRNFASPEEFLPERWLSDRPRGDAHNPAATMPFGSGPRTCPGRSLAMLEMRVVLTMLLRSFDVERVGHSNDVRERFAFTVIPEELRVKLDHRSAQTRVRVA